MEQLILLTISLVALALRVIYVKKNKPLFFNDDNNVIKKI